MPTVLDILKSQKEELFRRHQVAQLALFGSHSRGEARPESDVDILVAFQNPATFDRYMDLKGELESLLGQKVDLVTEAALRPQLREAIRKEARYVP